MTVRDYVINQIQEVSDSWSERVHAKADRTPEDENDLIRVSGMNIAINIICGIELSELDQDVEEIE